MILPFPRKPANDNCEAEVWVCRDCEGAAFLLYVEHEATVIRCANCNLDVTQQIIPTVAVDLSNA